MKVYHGTNQNFSKLDVNKTSEYGLYFGLKREVAESYGKHIHQVVLSYNNLCDLTSYEGIKTALALIPELLTLFAEESILDDVSELEEEFEHCATFLDDSGVMLENDKCLRDELLKALKLAGHDAVLIQDYTDGDKHLAYVVFDNSNFKYAA